MPVDDKTEKTTGIEEFYTRMTNEKRGGDRTTPALDEGILLPLF